MIAVDNIIERFEALDAQPVCRAGFVKRVPGIDVKENKAQVLERLDHAHAAARRSLGMTGWPLITAQQVHGNRVAVIDRPINADQHLSGYDGFVTNQPRTALGVHVADCCAVYILDPKTPAIGLVHSGKKGSELAIAVQAIETMRRQFGSDPADLVVQLSPCIRPPHYEIDFADQIREQCRDAGIRQIHDCGICTACDLASYYSYRMESGKTGRMLALLGLV
jgi:copper oxidase (laccase) domain-containing protein